MSMELDRNAEIRRLRESGMSLDQIGSCFGITRERVRQIVKNAAPNRPIGRPSQLGMYDEATIRMIVTYVNAGLKTGLAASELGISKTLLCNRLRRIADSNDNDPRTFFGLRAILSDYSERGVICDCGNHYEICHTYKKTG